jgi:hypothetical protein
MMGLGRETQSTFQYRVDRRKAVYVLGARASALDLDLPSKRG